ncbi:MAG TPA: FAD:protein FMN transferase [Bacteroidales bacterium]|nr:FAD:protein FMN transferase [Bacteroidales bacterium]
MNYKKFFIQILLLVFFFALAFLITKSGKKGEYVGFVGFAQGTTYRITYESKKGEHYQAMVDSLLKRIDRSLSIYDSNSFISKFNRNDPGIQADLMFNEVFNKSAEVNQKTYGAFDITVGPIVNALGFGSGDTLNVDSTMIDSLLNLVGMDKVKLENRLPVKSDPRIQLDMNAIAQGYSVDIIALFLESKRIKNYLVEIGGEVRTKGRNDRNMIWKVGIDRPVENNVVPGADLQAIISLKNKALATSGNYRKFYMKNGIKFVHTIDPKTGYPVISNLLSATVIADDCATADAYATALMVMGLDKSIEFLKNKDFLEAFLIYANEQGQFRTYTTQGLEKFIE